MYVKLLFKAQERAKLRVPLEHDSGGRGDFCETMSGPWAVNSNAYGPKRLILLHYLDLKLPGHFHVQLDIHLIDTQCLDRIRKLDLLLIQL